MEEVIGRYTLDSHTEDVVFHSPNITEDIKEYLVGNSGYYGMWTYDLKSSKLSKLTMEWIEELPRDKRDRRTVIRHLMSKMSSENSDNALMVGRWGGLYTEDGKPPTHWINTSSIFEQRLKTGKPVRYGQCWCFAECMTSMLRYLNIPCRTVCGTNIMIDENLDNGIDFKQDLRKDESSNSNLVHMNKDYIDDMLKNILNEQGSKSEWENLRIYDCGDSTWNFHYWNEVWLQDSNGMGKWEAIDSTPTLTSDYDGKKMLGPSALLEKRDGSLDFSRFFAMVNSPFRLWATETINENDKSIDIPYVYSIIFPHSKRKSKYLKNPKILALFDKRPNIKIKSNYRNVDITSHYRADDIDTENMYFSNFKSRDMLYLQTVYLDYSGNVIKIDRFRGTLENYRHRRVDIVPTCYLTSCLAIELLDEKEKRTPNFIAFCSYYTE